MRKQIANKIVELAAPYTPFQQGILSKPIISSDGSKIIYPQPYAHYQYEGIVRGPNYTNGDRFWSGNAPKQPTGAKLTYSGAPMRGAKWIERMLIDKHQDIEKDILTKF